MTVQAKKVKSEDKIGSPYGYWFARVDRKVIMDQSLSSRDLHIYVVLCAEAGRERSVSLTVKEIGEMAACKERTTQMSLKKLAERGLIERIERFENGFQRMTTYRLIGCQAECYMPPQEQNEMAKQNEGKEIAPPAENCAYDSQISAPQVLKTEFFPEKEEILSPLTPQGVNGKVEDVPEFEKTRYNTERQERALNNELCLAVLEKYHAILPELASVGELLPAHVRNIEARIRDDPARKELAWWEHYFRRIRDLPCPMGKSASGWKADFGWLIGKKGIQKIIDNKFLHASSAKGGSESGWETQKQYTNGEGEVDARALLRNR